MLLGVIQLELYIVQVRSRYEKSFKDSEKAQEAHKKAEADIHLSRADVEKAKVLMRTRIQQCEQCKVDYASVLLTTNRAQNEHYQLLMPQVFQVTYWPYFRYITFNALLL